MQHLPQAARMRGVTISRVIRRVSKTPEAAQDMAAVRETAEAQAVDVATAPAVKA